MKTIYHLVDYNHQSFKKKVCRAYLVAASIAVKYGKIYYQKDSCIDKYLREFWPDKLTRPSPTWFEDHIEDATVRQYIKNYISLNNTVWNADFIQGVCCNGNISEGEYYPSLTWEDNQVLDYIISLFSLGGKKGHNKIENMPSLCLNYSNDSLSFMAGVLGGGQLVTCDDGFVIVCYRNKAKSYIEDWKIPIFKKENDAVYISPVWAALFSLYMPKDIKKIWLNIRKPYQANILCPILWKTYIGEKFVVKGIPYLCSRRKIYYDFSSKDEKAMKKLNRLRVEMGLTELPNRIGDVVKEWEKLCKNKEIK